MAGINKVILVGNLGQDPEVKYTPDGKAVTRISLATSESWKDKNTGQRQERTEWHRIVFFGGIAGIAGEYLKRGSKIYVEGKLRTQKWQDQNGQDRWTTEVIVDSFGGTMQMLDSRSGGDTAFDQSGRGNQTANNNYQQNQNQNQAPQQSYQQNQAPQAAPQQQTPDQSPQSSPQSPQPQQQSEKPAAQPFEDEFDDDIPF